MKNLTLDNQVVDQTVQPLSRATVDKVLLRRLIISIVGLTCITTLMVRPDLIVYYAVGGCIVGLTYMVKIFYDTVKMDFDMTGIDISINEIIDDLGR